MQTILLAACKALAKHTKKLELNFALVLYVLLLICSL